jgi:hypothetical protein
MGTDFVTRLGKFLEDRWDDADATLDPHDTMGLAEHVCITLDEIENMLRAEGFKFKGDE